MRSIAALAVLTLVGSGCLLDPTDDAAQALLVARHGECEAKESPATGIGPHAWEQWRVAIDSAQSWTVAVPLLVGVPHSSIQDWLGNVTLDGAHSAQPNRPEDPSVLVVKGRGPGEVCSTSYQPVLSGAECCAWHFVESAWTTGTDTGDERPEVLVWTDGAGLRLRLSYDAVDDAETCGRHATFEQTLNDVGWAAVAGTDATWECSA